MTQLETSLKIYSKVRYLSAASALTSLAAGFYVGDFQPMPLKPEGGNAAEGLALFGLAVLLGGFAVFSQLRTMGLKHMLGVERLPYGVIKRIPPHQRRNFGER